MSSANAPAIEAAADIPEVETEHLGFKALGQGKQGPKKVKILSEPWPTDRLPPASANLLSVSSTPGLLAAAGPKRLVVVSTQHVQEAFKNKTASDDITRRDIDVVSDLTPDVTISVPDLRHVAFSTDGDFLVTSAEDEGGVNVYDVAGIVKHGRKDPHVRADTGSIPLRALLPNPASEYSHYFVIVLDSGKLQLCTVQDGSLITLREDGVSCAAWSTRGKAVVAGLKDGTCAIYMSNGELKGVVPRPPDVDESYQVSGLTWLDTKDFLVVYSLKQQEDEENPEPDKFYLLKSNKGWTSFTCHTIAWDPLPPAFEAPSRPRPARFSSMRLRNWKPDLEDMLIITSSHTDTVGVLASTSSKISPDQENCDELMILNLDDTKRAGAPRTAYGEDELDSVFIGEALDLSSREKILRPIAALEEINEAPWPLPAYMALTHEGLLSAWWVVWSRSIEAGTRYPGLVVGSEESGSSPAVAATPTSAQTPSAGGSSSVFGKPTATFGTPANAPSGNGGLMRPTPPGFGTPGFGSPSTPLPAPTFGKPTQPAFGAPSSVGQPAQPAFGAPSAIRPTGGSGFGAAGGIGNKPSPWAAQQPQSSETKANPFSAAAGGSSGFAKFGQTGGSSSFSSFGSNNGAQSGFGSLGQGQQQSGFSGLKTEPSFGSTVTLGSGTGSSLQGSSLFGQQNKSSFNTASFGSKESDMSDAGRQRDEATPTPQNPPAPQSQNLFGLAGGFKLGTTFSGDGTAKDDPAKPAAPTNGSFFGSDFASTLGGSGMKPPETPSKEEPESVSFTPASPPKQSFFPSSTPATESATPKAAPPTQKKAAPVDDAPLPPDFTKSKPSKPDDAPLPPDFINTKLPQSTSDDLPPLAGSPGVEVEAPGSSAEVSPIDNEEEEEEDEEDFSPEEDDDEGEDDEDEEDEQPTPSNAGQKSQPMKSGGGWNLHNTIDPSQRVFPPAPTPPVLKSGATSQSGRSASPAQSSLFGQPSKPASSQPQYSGSLFGKQSQQEGPFSGKPSESLTASKPNLPPPSNRAQNLRSPSPVRPASASRIRREPIVAPGASLSSSIQQSKPPTPQPQVSDLEDEEDDRMRAQLAQPIEPSRDLEEFVAYQNYTGNKSPSKSGHAAQIEMIYRDINGMIDSLGWNARSIKSFTQYHKQPQSGHQVDKDVLEDAYGEGHLGAWFEKFTLCEIDALRALEEELEQELDAGRVQDVLDKLTQLARLLREKAKLMTRLNDIRRQIITRKDPDKAEALRKAPLPKELADGQKALRNDYAQLLTSLNKAEDAITILRTRLASHNAQNGQTAAVPTMDAVKRTVNKMSTMVEKRNNDILHLESQMRKIGLTEPSRPSSSSSRHAGTPRRTHGTNLRSSIADTPYATPPTRNRMSLSELNRRALTPEVEATPTPSKGYGLFYTPEGSPTPGNQIAHLSDLVDENMDGLRETARKRREVATGLKNALVKRGVKTTKVNSA